MSSDYREIEVKFYVPALDAVRERLEALGAELSAPRVYERNIRYDNAERTLAPRGVIVRLRQDTRARLTYKESGETTSSGLYSRFEAEVEVSDFDTMDMILTRLGFEASMIYEKYRTTYLLEGAEVVLDEMPYGNFVEVEGHEPDIIRALERLELGSASRYQAGYGALFENVRRNLNLPFRDLTFTNFSGILVPEDAFKSPNM